jgi:uncharacterized membrane protein YccC
MDLYGLLTDQMGHFTPADLWGLVLGMLLAALLAFGVGALVRGPEVPDARVLAVLAAVVALAVALVRAQVPLAIALVAVALLFKPSAPSEGWRSRLPQFIAVVLGAACGSSAGIAAVVAFLPLVLLLRWALASKPS